MKAENLYGFAVVRPEPMCAIDMQPLSAMEQLVSEARDVWDFVIVPAFLVALSVTCFAWAFHLI